MVTFTLGQIIEAMADMSGFCLLCGEEQSNVEPDARDYQCEFCDGTVYGAEELLIMGRVQ